MTTRNPVVVLDPGHGGTTEAGGSSPNNTSGGGLLEKDVVLDVARRVREQLAGRARVLLTRDSDTNLSLTERAGFARATTADVFVSLHCNGHVDPTHDSTEVYIRRSASAADRRFATDLHRALREVIAAPDGGIVEADLGVLLAERHAPSTVAALVELLDLTNPSRVEDAANVDFLDLVATAVANTVDIHLVSAMTNTVAGPSSGPTALQRAGNGSASVSARTPAVERVAASLRERGVPADDVERFLAELEGRPAPQPGVPAARVLEDGRLTVELPPAHLFKWWQAELIRALLATSPLGTLLPALQALSTRFNVTIGIGPSVSGGMVAGAGLSVGVVIAPGDRLGFYGTVSGLKGAIVSISATVEVTVVFGGPSRFSGSAVAVGMTFDLAVGPGIGAHLLMSPDGGVIGVTGEVGLTVGLSPFEAFAQYQYTATTLATSGVRSRSIDERVTEVLTHIHDEARRRAATPIPMSSSSVFMDVLRSRYLADYLANPSPETGRAAVEAIGAQNTSGVVTDVCGAPDQWEQGTPQWNQSPIPSMLRNIPGMGELPSNFGAATAILAVANRRALDHIDLPFLVGRHTVDELDCANRRDAIADADWVANNGINTSQLMHWATGVRFAGVPHELLRDLFLAYELWHLELWDVFGHDPINDLIVEDAGRHLAARLVEGSVTAATLSSVVADGFRQARRWVGGLLALRARELDEQITALEPPAAVIHWVGRRIAPDDINHPYRIPSIRQMITDGQTVSAAKASRLVEDYIAVHTLIAEAAADPPALSAIQRMEADGSLDGLFRALAGAEAPRPLTSPIGGALGGGNGAEGRYRRSETPVVVAGTAPIVTITHSVGRKGANRAFDVAAIKARLHGLGFTWVPKDGVADADLTAAIRLFQAIKNGHHTVDHAVNDGRVDAGGDTLAWLQATNCPRWQLMDAGQDRLGFVNIERQDTSDTHDFGTDWLNDTIVAAGAHYRKAWMDTHTAAPITVNDASLEKGGHTDDHRGHQTGLSVDLRLPKTSGAAPPGTVSDADYDRDAMRAMLQAFRAQPRVTRVFLEDQVLMGEGLCTAQPGHDNHAHVEIAPPPRGPTATVSSGSSTSSGPSLPSVPLSSTTGPLTPSEWELLTQWQSAGQIGTDQLTADADANAVLVASAIFCGRWLGSDDLQSADPLLCVDRQVTAADPRVGQLVPQVTARGPIINWTARPLDQRRVYVMQRLIQEYGYPVSGAAGIVGNLEAESDVLPDKVEGSRSQKPMRARNFQGVWTDFTAEEVRNRSKAAQQGPQKPGVGLAQWTTSNRRTGLFTHAYQGHVRGAAILFDMDAQIDYIVHELRNAYNVVNNVLTDPAVTVDDAADEFVYNYEIPGRILTDDGAKKKLPRHDAAVQAVFRDRRTRAQEALTDYRRAQAD